MDRRYQNYSRRKFQEWRQRVGKLLPEASIIFYSAKMNGKYIPYEKEKLLGIVIKEINNPFYGIMTDSQDRIPEDQEIVCQVVLNILTEELFQFVNTECKQLC